MNVLTVKKKLFICEVTTYIYEVERQERLGTSDTSGTLPTFPTFPTFAQTAKFKFWQTFSANLPIKLKS